MGDSIGKSDSASTSSTAQQVATQGGAAGSTTTSVGAGSSGNATGNSATAASGSNGTAGEGGGAVGLGYQSSINNSDINITSSDPAVVKEAIDVSGDVAETAIVGTAHALDDNTQVSTDSIDAATTTAIGALQLAQSEQTSAASQEANAAVVANNAQDLAYGAGTQQVATAANTDTFLGISATKLTLYLSIAGLLLAGLFLIRKKI